MADLTAGFETGVQGNGILTSDAGDATAWDVVTNGTGGSNNYDNTHPAFGSLACKSVRGSAGNCEVGWTTALGTVTDHYGRAYVWIDSAVNPSSNAFVEVRKPTRMARIDFQLSGTVKIRIIDSPATGDLTGGVTVSRDQLIRVEWHIIHSATVGQIEVKLFNTADSTTPSETITSPATWNTGADANEIYFGARAGAGATGFTIWHDNIIANATSYPGPVITASANFAPVIYGRGAA